MSIEDPIGEITVLTGAEVVRRRPRMYVDFDDRDIAATLVMQSLCHAVDDAMDGLCKVIHLQVNGPCVEVHYDSGMPLGSTPELPGRTVAEIFLTIHASCHSRKKHIEVGSEFCRIGLAVLNAVCSDMSAQIAQGGKSASLRFVRGELCEPVVLEPTEEQDGTCLRFTLDASVLGDAVVVPAEAALRRAIDALHAGFPKLAVSLAFDPRS